jgi:integrase
MNDRRRLKPLTVSQLVTMYLDHYRPLHPSSVANVKSALEWLTDHPVACDYQEQLWSTQRVGDLKPSCLCRSLLVDVRTRMDRAKKADGESRLKRKTINGYLKMMTKMIDWAIEAGLMDEAESASALMVKTLTRGQAISPEYRLVTSAPDADTSVLIAQARPMLATMVWLQRWTGMRKGELLAMNIKDIDRSCDDVWLYCPSKHKNAHRGHQRNIVINNSFKLLRKAERDGDTTAEPKRHVHGALDRLREWIERSISDSGIVFPGKHGYQNKDSYPQALRREQERAGIRPPFTSHQLRHSFATWATRNLGKELAQVLLGHASIRMTERYEDEYRPEEMIALARDIT